MIALLGIPDLGWAVWLVISVAFAIDAGVFFIGWCAARNRERREAERERNRRPVPKHFKAIGGVDRDFDRRAL